MKDGGKIREFLKNKAPKLLHKVGEFMPDKGALGIIKNIILTATPDEISDFDKEQAIKLTDEEILKFIEKENEDRHSARNLQIESLKQDDKFSKRFIYFLASFVILSATGFACGLFFFEIPEGNRRMIEMFADVYLFTGAITVLAFFFGSSYTNKLESKSIK
jgi:uncharacterized membrane protein